MPMNALAATACQSSGCAAGRSNGAHSTTEKLYLFFSAETTSAAHLRYAAFVGHLPAEISLMISHCGRGPVFVKLVSAYFSMLSAFSPAVIFSKPSLKTL